MDGKLPRNLSQDSQPDKMPSLYDRDIVGYLLDNFDSDYCHAKGYYKLGPKNLRKKT